MGAGAGSSGQGDKYTELQENAKSESIDVFQVED